MKSAIAIGTKVIGKNGNGIITNIITKSTGYVEVTYNSGIVKKEMAFNITDENGVSLKKKPESNHQAKISAKLSITSSGSFDSMFSSNNEKQDWLEERERKAWASIGE